jgi:hypothetical protein
MLSESASISPFSAFTLSLSYFEAGSPSIQVSDVLVLFCKLINFVFQIFRLFIPEMTVDFMSYVVQTSNYFLSLLQEHKAPTFFQVLSTSPVFF